jgi:hypothetical protein
MPTTALNAANQTISLGDAGIGTVTTKTVKLNLGTTPMVGSFAIQGRVLGEPASASFVPIPYKRRVLAAAASDDTVVSAAITGNAIIEINAAGLEIQIVWTYTSGVIGTGAAVTWQDMDG